MDKIKYGYCTLEEFHEYYNSLMNKGLKFLHNFSGMKVYQFNNWHLGYKNKELQIILFTED